MRMDVESVLAVLGHPSLAFSPLYHCHIWRRKLTALRISANITGTQHKENIIRTHQTHSHDSHGHRSQQVCAPKVIYCVLLTPKTTGPAHGAYIYLETQTVVECIRHADAALHL